MLRRMQATHEPSDACEVEVFRNHQVIQLLIAVHIELVFIVFLMLIRLSVVMAAFPHAWLSDIVAPQFPLILLILQNLWLRLQHSQFFFQQFILLVLLELFVSLSHL